MSTVFCTDCGVRNQGKSKFCFKCGNALQKQVINAQKDDGATPKEPKAQNETQLAQNETKQAQSKEDNAPGSSFHFSCNALDFVPTPKEDETTKKGETKATKTTEPIVLYFRKLKAIKRQEGTDKGTDKEVKSGTDKATKRPEGSPPQKNSLCRYYGSAKGCENGGTCIYSHANPNSIRLCKFYNVEWGSGCPFEEKCKFRHRIYGLEQYSDSSGDDSSDNDGHRHAHGEKEVVQISKLKHQISKIASNTAGGPGTTNHITKTDESALKQTDKSKTKGEEKAETKEEAKVETKGKTDEAAKKISYSDWGAW